jgi:glutaconate CoA-transferase subunit B
MYGNFNNIAFGDDYQKPRMRLPGTGGIPDVTTYFDKFCLYVPRHSRVTFVAELDYISGLGHHPSRLDGSGPVYLISNLGQFDFFAPEGMDVCLPRMRLTSYHPGASIDRIRAKTGFPLQIAPHISETTPPTEEELYLLRNEIDPLGIRRLELLSGAERRSLLHQIIVQETGQ